MFIFNFKEFCETMQTRNCRIMVNKRQSNPKGNSRIDNIETPATLATRNRTMTDKIKKKSQKTKMMSNTERTQKETESNQLPTKGKNFLYFVCERGKKNIYIKGKEIHCHLRNGYFATINQFVMTTVYYV